MFQLLLFTIFFKVDPIAVPHPGAGAIEVSIEHSEQSLIFAAKEKEINEPNSFEKPSQHSGKVPKKFNFPDLKKVKPLADSKIVKKDNKEILSKKLIQNSEVAHTSHPFIVSGELKKRRIIESPNLPLYPKWALEADVELKLKIGVLVNKDGSVKRAWVIYPSGDSQTDNKILTFTENLKFESESWLSKGEISWEFKLKYQ